MHLLPKVPQSRETQFERGKQEDKRGNQSLRKVSVQCHVIIHHAEQQNKQARIKMPEQTKLHSKKLISCVFN